jgi:hypothetical protein
MGRMVAVLLAALAVEATPAAGTPAAQRVVEEVVAVVRNPPGAPPRLVTLTRLVEEARIALVARGATEAAAGPLDAAALRAALEWHLDEVLVADEAARLAVDDVDRAAVQAEVRRFAARFRTPAAYQAFLAASELTEEEVASTLARGLRVQRYVESRVGRAVRVADDEVDRWLRARGVEPTPGAAREGARAQLEEERARAHVKELLAELRARADVRILDPLRGEPGAGG